MTAQVLLSRLDRVKQTAREQWVACCPSHDSKSGQSLAVTERDGKVLVHCFAGCDIYEVLSSVGLEIHHLFPDTGRFDPARGAGDNKRMRISYADAMRCVEFEALLAATAACNVANGHQLTAKDKNRLLLASNRISKALEVCR